MNDVAIGAVIGAVVFLTAALVTATVLWRRDQANLDKVLSELRHLT